MQEEKTSHPRTPPCRWCPLVRRVARGLCLLLAVGVMLVGLAAVVLYGIILPRIDDFRPALAQLASRTMGRAVTIGRLEVTRYGWEPQIEMHDVALADGHGHPGLQIRSVEAVVSLPAALRRGFERLTVIAPRLEARRNADGSIEMAGNRLEEGRRGDSGPILGWLLSQPELSIRDGSVRWTDARRQVPPLELTAVQATLRNGRFTHHALTLSATPPQGWGQPIRLLSEWDHPLFRDRTLWRNWDGAAYADMPQLDVSQLRRYVDLGAGFDLRKGRGSVRLWGDFRHLRNSTLTVQLHLDEVDVVLGRRLPPLALRQLDSMASVQYDEPDAHTRTVRFATQQLDFTTYSNRRWPGGNVQLEVTNGTGSTDSSGRLQGANWDLGIIGELAGRLPLGDALLRALYRYRPGGTMQALEMGWSGNLNQPATWYARGKATQLQWSAQAGPYNRQHGRQDPGVPGVEGAAVDFYAGQAGGRMHIALHDGAVVLPGVFEEPRVPFDRFQAEVRWTVKPGGAIEARMPSVRFANADASGALAIGWHTRPLAPGEAPAARFPGFIDLSATLDRARADRVHRYLPLSLGEVARTYVRDAVRDGDIRHATVRVKGDLAQVPFAHQPPGAGIFRFEVPLHDAHYQFVPPSLQHAGDLPWPALTHLDGRLVIDRLQLRVVDATGRFSTAPDMRVRNLAAVIPDLSHGLTVGVSATMEGPLAQALHLATTSPLGGMSHHALDHATATGQTRVQLALGLPIHAMRHAVVRGEVALQGNDVRITPGSPLLAASHGTVAFTETGFLLREVRARMLGGESRIEGGMASTFAPGASHEVRFTAEGQLTAEGLYQDRSIALVSALAPHMRGTSRYRATLHFAQGMPELVIDSDLQGMALDLPVPLAKAAGARLPLHVENVLAHAGGTSSTPRQDRLAIRLGDVAAVHYLRDIAHGTPRVLRGTIAVGREAVQDPPPMPASGVQALLKVDTIDVSQWQRTIDTIAARMGARTDTNTDTQAGKAADKPADAAAGTRDGTSSAASASAASPAGATASGSAAGQGGSAADYLPTIVGIEARALMLADRRIDNLVAGGTREGQLWRITLDARQLSGYLEYLQPTGDNAGSLKARLDRLVIEPATVQDVRRIVQDTRDPERLPALDIDAAHVDVLGYRFDRITLLASNRAKAQEAGATLTDEGNVPVTAAWRIHDLVATTPHGRLQGSGLWGTPGGARAAAARTAQDGEEAQRKRVALRVRVETDDLGALLAHFGLPDLVSGGAGVVAGTVRWRGSPIAVDWNTVGGTMRLDVRHGSITRVDPGAARFIGLLSVNALARLGQMGSKGLAFDRVDGTLQARGGEVHSDDLEVTGPLADVQAVGDFQLPTQTMHVDLMARPRIDLGGAALVATALNPVVGLGSYVAQLVLSEQIRSATTQVMRVTGPWQSPQVQHLAGDEAHAVALRILSGHAHPQPVDRLWNWQPVTHPQTDAAVRSRSPAAGAAPSASAAASAAAASAAATGTVAPAPGTAAPASARAAASVPAPAASGT